ncbi:MAG TPA: serine/threonine-protein kinase [Candidatus Thermoplasmatota archaeon]|nr:serine/threonine-protein kinase [Candidatus Thermoplasmatota archaeon]
MPNVEALVALASGAALASLGAFLLAIRPRRWDSALFGAFAILWAGQVILANLWRLTDGGARVHGPALIASFAMMAPATVLLAHHAASHLGGRGGDALRAGGVLAGAAGALALALAPRLVVESVADGPDGVVLTVLGPLAFPLLLAPFHLAFVAAAVSAYARWRRAAPGSPQRRARAVFAAFALFSSYVVVRNLALVLRMPADLRLADGQQVLSIATYAGGALLLLGLLAHAAARGPRLDRGMWLAVGVPAGMAAVEAAFAPGSVLGTGTWRLACVGVVAYALARHQLFDFELRVKESAAALLAALLLGVGILAAVARQDALPVLVAAVAAGATLAVREPLGRVLYPKADLSPAYVRSRQLDVYRVRLEEAIARPAHGDEADLRRFRRALHITHAEHVAMENVLRAHHGIGREGEMIAQRYQIMRVLGEGGFGRAHLARDARSGALVVVKLVPGDGAAREARLAGRIDSPHVVRVLDAGAAPGGSFLAMEYAEGGTLAERLEREGRLGPDEALRLADGLLAGLAAAHRAGVVHGDVKPDNVLLGADGAPRLGDFGGARSTDASRTRDSASQATLQYASPEQLRGEPATARSDVYSAAAVLHRAVTGRVRAPWDDEDAGLLADAPARLRSVVLRGLARDPAGRYADAGEMLADLRGEVSVRVLA